MAVKFLSTEWAEAVKAALNDNADFKKAAGDHKATIQQVISGDTETHYWIVVDAGTIDLGVGDAPAPDATISQSYDTAVGLANGSVSAVTAFMTGKIKVTGNMGMLLGLQGALGQLPVAMATLDVEY